MKGTGEVLQEDSDAVVPARAWRRFVRPVLSIALAAFMLGFVLPNAVGTTASQVSKVLRQNVTAFDILILVLVWAAGILVHSLTLTGALPGLSTRRAVTLNLTGSSVSNVMPFGGAVGMSLNYVMIRSWGMDATQFAAYTVVTNIWVILIKLALPAIAAVGLVATGVSLSAGLTWGLIASAVGLAAMVTLVVSGLVYERIAIGATNGVMRVVVRVAAVFGRKPDAARVLAAVLATRDTVRFVFQKAWLRMGIGMLGWTASQTFLLWYCLHVVGVNVDFAIIFAGYAIDRVLTMIVLTPGASGFVETGTAVALAYLTGVGDHTAEMITAGVLLYRAFSYAIEIPVGGVWLGGWLLARRRKRGELQAEEDLVG